MTWRMYQISLRKHFIVACRDRYCSEIWATQQSNSHAIRDMVVRILDLASRALHIIRKVIDRDRPSAVQDTAWSTFSTPVISAWYTDLLIHQKLRRRRASRTAMSCCLNLRKGNKFIVAEPPERRTCQKSWSWQMSDTVYHFREHISMMKMP